MCKQVQAQGPADLRSVTVTSVHPLALEHTVILRAHFGVCGRIVRATVLRNQATGKAPNAPNKGVWLQQFPDFRDKGMVKPQMLEVLRSTSVHSKMCMIDDGELLPMLMPRSLPRIAAVDSRVAGMPSGKVHIEYTDILAARKALRLSRSLLLDRPVHVRAKALRRF